MAVLLQFNECDRWTLKQLSENTQIKMDILKQVLGIILKSKLLITEEKNESEETLKDNTVICLFPALCHGAMGLMVCHEDRELVILQVRPNLRISQ